MSRTPARHVVDLITGYWASQSVYVATKLKIPEHLAANRMTSHELAAATGTHQPSLFQVLRLLAGLGVLEGDDDTGFALTAAGDLLTENAPDSLRDLVMIYGEEFYQAWGGLLHNVQTGQPAFEHVFGAAMYPYFKANPESARKFDGAMSGGSFFAALPAAVDFSTADTIVDVAGGTGGLLCTLLDACPQARGVLFDVDHVIESAESVVAGRGVYDRLSLVVGDYQKSVPADGDVYVLSRILHSLDEERSIALLERCYEAMPEHGRIVVIERLVPPPGTNSLGLAFDVQMMVAVGGGEYSESYYRNLFERAGFALDAAHELPLDMFALVGNRSFEGSAP